jgi:hypothetical protein
MCPASGVGPTRLHSLVTESEPMASHSGWRPWGGQHTGVPSCAVLMILGAGGRVLTEHGWSGRP